MKVTCQSFYRGERGDGVIPFLFITLIALILMLISVSIYQAYTIRGNLQTACNETLQLMKVDNGADSKTKDRFDTLLTKMGMNPKQIDYDATPKGDLNRGDSVEISASTNYKVFALKAVGMNVEVPITAKAIGFAHKYIREGDGDVD